MIELFHVCKRYPGGQMGLDDVSLRIPKGEMIFLTGASGAGKSTFLKLIYREEVPSSGSILVNGRNVSSLPHRKIPYLRRTIGVVFQSFRLIQRKTVFENVSYLPRLLGLDGKEQRQAVFETLSRVGLAHRASAFPLQLSGGEQQRVAIARALISQPEILLADEPTGNLDPELSEEILKLFLRIHQKGTTVIFATHDRELIHRVGRRVLTLDQGRLVEDRYLEPTGEVAVVERGTKRNDAGGESAGDNSGMEDEAPEGAREISGETDEPTVAVAANETDDDATNDETDAEETDAGGTP